TTTIRFTQNAVVSVCSAPIYMAEDFLKAEGFTDVQYIKTPNSLTVSSLVAGESDMTMQFSGPSNIFLDQGKPLTVLAGVHVGCFVLFGREHVKSIGDLKGKTVSITVLGGPEHVYLASMLAYVGLNPTTDVNWIVLPQPEGRQRFID